MVLFNFMGNNTLAMNTRRTLLDAQTLSDILLFALVVIGLFLVMDNFSELQKAFNDVVLGTVHDIKASIAETQAGR